MRATLLLAAALLGSAHAATADEISYFAAQGPQEPDFKADFVMVRSAEDAVVEVYDFAGTLLGSKDVHAGANPNVFVVLRRQPSTDLVAVLRSGDEILAQTRVLYRPD